MSEPFMFRDAPSQPKEEPSKAKKNTDSHVETEPTAAKPIVSTSRRGSPVGAAVDDDFEVLVRILGMLQHRTPYSRERLLNAIKTILGV